MNKRVLKKPKREPFTAVITDARNDSHFEMVVWAIDEASALNTARLAMGQFSIITVKPRPKIKLRTQYPKVWRYITDLPVAEIQQHLLENLIDDVEHRQEIMNMPDEELDDLLIEALRDMFEGP